MAFQTGKRNSRDKRIGEKLSTLPSKPGVYTMLDPDGKILYVGKAKRLSSRVRSYFRGTLENPRIASLVARIADIEYIVTDSEVEALILESNLIKEHRPRYNVNLKDDKRYPYLKVTVNEPFPRVLVTRRYLSDGARYYGPYTNAGALRTTLEVLRKVFPLRSCSHKLPEKRGARECLNFHLGKCSGPCHGHISREDYAAMVAEVLQFLNGKTERVARRLKEQMQQASIQLDFELASRYRDQLSAVHKVSERQKMHALGGGNGDFLAVSVDGSDACVVVLKIRSGKLIGSEHRYLKNGLREPPSAVLNAFIGQNYISDREYPGEIYLSQDIKDRESLEEILSRVAARRVKMHVPGRGDKARLIEMAEKNSNLFLEELVMRREKARQRVPEALLGLQKTLKLPRLPRIALCFDVSTIQGAYAVAAMSYFRNGYPYKAGYRRFRIHRQCGQDDFAMINEAVRRYFERVAKGELEMPHLVVIDGGKGQLGSACEAIRETGVALPPVIALAKKEEELYFPDTPAPYSLSRRSEALKLLQRLRDEAHRFALAYHRSVRKKETLRTRLEEIPGVGPARTRTLLKAFGSPSAVAQANDKQLTSLQGISQAMARRIIEYMKGEKTDAEST